MAPKDDTFYLPRFRRLEERLLLNATPESAVVDLPQEELINQDFDFSVSFDNTATAPSDIGYGPFVDVTVGPGIEVNDVSFQGDRVTFQVVGVWDGSNWIDANGDAVAAHPLDASGGLLELPAGSEIGETWLNVLAPFGSYTPEQPAIDLDFSAELAQSADGVAPGAVPGQPVLVTARGGFQFGEDPLDNPSIDPPVQQGTTQSDTITPIVLKIDKEVNLPEDETAQGPNFPFTYTISVDIADGASVSDIRITDLLPDNLFILGTSTNITADSVLAPGDGTNPEGVPGRDTITTAEFVFADTSLDPNAAIVGGAGEGEIVITLLAYAPDLDASNDLIIDPDTPTAAVATNATSITANFDGNPIDDTTSAGLSDTVDLSIRPYTVLKTVEVEGGGPAIPGEYLKFTIEVDISDFQGFEELVLNDVLSDGLTLDTTDDLVLEHTPVMSLAQNGTDSLIDFEEGFRPLFETELETTLAADGTQQLTFFISNALRNNNQQGTLSGDLFLNDGQQGATTFTLVYFAKIEETFREPGRGPVVSNDTLTNSVSLDANSQTSGNQAQPDGSSSEVTVNPPAPSKSIYAVNGVQGAPTDVAPGDEVTYRLRLEFDSLDTDGLKIEDFLPAPVYDVDANGTGFTFVDSQGGLPAAFTIIRGPDDTASGASGVAGAPTVVTDGAGNAISITFANFDETGSTGGVIDLLYTITVTDEPFADGLLLVNQAVITTGNSTVAVANEDSVVGEIILREPVLSLTKGVVATDAEGGPVDPLTFDPATTAPSNIDFTLGTPGFTVTSPLTSDDLAAEPIVSDLAGFDAGDTVKFAIVIENTGGQDGFDIELSDILPTGFAVPASFNLDVRYGDGTEILFDATPDGSTVSFSGDLFNSALIINDPTGTGAIAEGETDDGRNIIIVSYELIAEDDFKPGVTVTNEAELLSFAATEGGTNFTIGVDGQFTDEVELESQSLDLDKRLIATDQTFTSGNDLAIGEVATFLLEVTVPDGETPATVFDDLPEGFAIVGSPILRTTFTNGGGALQIFDGTLAQGGSALGDGDTLLFTTNGNDLTIDFSSILANAAAGTDLTGQVFAIEYRVVATDDPALSAGDTVSNSATVDTPTTDPTAPASVAVDIVEPELTITKTFSPDSAEGGDVVEMVLLIENDTGSDRTTSFGLELTDNELPLDVFQSVVSTGVVGSGGVDVAKVTVTIDATSDPDFFLITVIGDDDFAMAPGESLTLSFDLAIQPNVAIGTQVDNTATVESYSSLPGVVAGERIHGPETGSDTLVIDDPLILKFIEDTSFKPGTIIDRDPDVFVGEIITYQVIVNFPTGVAQQVRLLDDTELFAGDALGAVQIISVDDFIFGPGLEITGFTDLDNDGLLTAADAIIADTDGNGVVNQALFELGTVDSDPFLSGSPISLSTTIAFTVTAQVLNVPEADGGDIHNNLARVEFVPESGGVVREDDLFQITITEPVIDIEKTATQSGATLDAGDVVTYTLTVSHDGTITSGAPGFDLRIVDLLPDEMELIANSVTVTSFTAPGFEGLDLGDVTLDIAGNQVIVENFDLPLGQTATITYQARVLDSVVAAQVLGNQADLTYASLPVTDAGAAERRDGSNVDFTTFDPANPPRQDQSILNNYGDQALETVTISTPDGIEKTSDRETAADPVGEYTIGEVITYTINVPIIEGQTVDAVLVDTLPEGVSLVTGGGVLEDAFTVVDGNGATLPIVNATLTTSGNSEVIRLEFGRISNTGDNDTSNDFIQVQFSARVLNVAANQNGDIKENVATFSSTDQADRSDDADIRILEPDLALEKTADTAGPFDAGDVITYTLTAEHSAASTADAFEFAFTDSLPADVEFVQFVSAEIDGVDVSAQIILDGTSIRSIDAADLDIALGAQLTVVYQVRVKDEVNPGDVLANAFDGEWTSLDGDVNTGAIDGERSGNLSPDQNDYVRSDELELPVAQTFEIEKSVDAPDTSFAVGETVTYFIDVTVFEGTTENIVLLDIIAEGLSVDLGSLRVVDIGFAGAPVSIENAALSAGAILNTTRLSFELDNTPGDGALSIVNPGDALGDTTDNDTIRIAYDALVTNTIDNQNLTELDNIVLGQATGVGVAFGVAGIEVVEPKLSATKTNDAAGPIDAGDVVTFTVNVAHITVATDPAEVSTSDAFDLQLVDVVPADMQIDQIISAEIGGTDVSADFEIVGGEVRIRAGADLDLLLSEELVLVYEATALGSVSPGSTLTNTVDVTWTSTNGANPDERDGADGPPDGTDKLNDYAIVAQSTVTTGGNLSIDKGIDRASGDYAVGETVTYTLDIEVFEGTLTNVQIEDIVDPGLEIILGSITVVDIGFDGDPVTVSGVTLTGDSGAGATLGFALSNASGGRLVNNGDAAGNTDDNDTIRVTYQAVVSNLFSNQDGTVIGNVVEVTSDSGLSDTAANEVTVVEPEIEIDKQVVSPAGAVDAGDVVTYQVTLSNTGTSTAFDVTFEDTAPANSSFTGTASAVDGSNQPVGTFVINNGSASLTGFDIAVNGTVTITYTLVIEDTISAGDTLVNQADVAWTSTAGANPDERDGADGPGPDATVLDNYAATDQVVINAADFAIILDKTIVETSVSQTTGNDVAVGELITYQVRVAVTEGTTNALVLRDFLPEGLRYIDGTVQIVPGNAAATVPFIPGSESILANTNILNIPIGDLVNPGDNDPTNDSIDVFYQVVVEDDQAVVSDGDTLVNTVSAFTDTGLNDTDTAEVNVVEPDLAITKRANTPIIPLGNDVRYEIRVAHSAQSTVAAFDLVITDPLGTGFATLDPASVTAEIIGATGLPSPVIDLVSAPGFTILVPELPLGAILVIGYEATAGDTADADGQTIVNEATLDYDSIPGSDAPDEQRSYQASDDANVVIFGPDLSLIKEASVPKAAPGDTFEYTIQVLNKGVPNVNLGILETARNVVVTDTLPPDLTLLSVTVDGVAVTPSFIAGTRDFTIDLGNVPESETRLITLTVQVTSPASAIDDDSDGTDLLINTASVDMAQFDPTPEDNVDDALVPLLAVPDLEVTKTNAVEETGGGEIVTFTLTARNTGNRVAADVVIVDRVDTSVFEFVSATNGGVFDAASGTVTWRLDRLSPDDGEIDLGLSLRVLPGLPATLDETTNRVEISDNGLGGADPTPGNNVDTHTDRLIYPDLVITKNNNVDEVNPGDLVEFTITADNIGEFKADGVQVVDQIDLNVYAFVSASDDGVFDASTGTVTWKLGTLNPGDPVRVLKLVLEAQFPANGEDSATNVAIIESDGTRGRDSDLTNNIDDETDVLNAVPDPFEIAQVLGEDEEEEEVEEEPLLYASPLFTGIGPAGATINLVLVAADGTILQSGTTIAATDGSWLISIPDVQGADQPVSAVVTTFPSPVATRDGLAGSDVFSNPGATSPIVFERSFDLFTRSELDSAELLQQQIRASEAPGAISSRRFVNFDSVAGTAINGG
ncbi:DUF11 domain-containing protein [Rhodobacteraceae bacterium NNCM2]|nr:DUF11 domain-containing protein [Coraliihabitans acroporae]